MRSKSSFVAPILIEAFKALGGALPQAWSAHRWRYALSGAAGRTMFWDEEFRLGVCGDWLVGPRIESAWASGRALAAAMLR